MKEQDRLAMRAGLGVSVTENGRAFRLELVASGHDVVDLVADMMHAAGGIAFQEFRDRRALSQGMQQPWSGSSVASETLAPSVSR